MYQQQSFRPQPYLQPAISTSALLGQVLGIVAGGFVVTAIAAYVTAALALPFGVSLVAMLAGFGFIIAINAVRRNAGLSLLLFYAFTACEGIGLGPAIANYARTSGSEVVVEAAATTAMGMAVLGTIAYMTSFDYRKLAGLGFGLLLALVVVGIISAFTHFIHPQAYAWATLVVFTILTLVDFARLRAGGDGRSSVQLATGIYLDGVNIFLALLRIFGGRR